MAICLKMSVFIYYFSCLFSCTIWKDSEELTCAALSPTFLQRNKLHMICATFFHVCLQRHDLPVMLWENWDPFRYYKIYLQKEIVFFEHNICLSFGIFLLFVIHMFPINFSDLDKELYFLYFSKNYLLPSGSLLQSQTVSWTVFGICNSKNPII